MRRRLFWKILLGVWAMLILSEVGLWIWTAWEWSGKSGFRAQRLQNIEEWAYQTATLASIVVKYGGQAAFEAYLHTMSDEDRRPLTVQRITAAEYASSVNAAPALPTAPSTERPVPAVVTVMSPEGPYHVIFTPEFPESALRFPIWGYLPPRVLIVQGLAALLFSMLLAWHVTRPVQQVRRGMDLLARGDLSARLRADAWLRRDELGDLARDFDRVAERLEALVRNREQLLSDVSHECRSPLARCRLAIDLARQDPSKTESSLARIDQELQRLDSMVGELLTLARAESGEMRTDGFVDVPDLVKAVVSDAQLEAVSAQVMIRLHAATPGVTDDGLPPVAGEVELLRRSLDNILRNAIAVSAAGQIIEVSVEAALGAQQFVIVVADQGPGVAPEALNRMFQPFVRVGETRSAGFGLGLAIAKRAIAALGGSIAASNRDGGGLRVRICLPFAAADSPERSAR